MRIQRAQVHVGVRSLHYRLYRYTQRHSRPKPFGHRENLCHYIRCVLIWAPLLWFFKVPLFRRGHHLIGWIRPWMLAFGTLLAASVAYAFRHWPGTSWQVLIYSAITAGAIAGVIGIIVGGVFLWTRNEELSQKVFTVITFPVWGPLIALALVVIVLFEYVLEPYGPPFLRWFFTRRYLRVIFPWFVFALIATAGSYQFLGSHITLVALAIIGGIIGFLAALIGIVLGLYWVFSADEYDAVGRFSSWREERKPEIAYRNVVVPQKNEKGTSVFRIIWRWILTKKWKICPFIILPSEADASTRSM